MAAGGAGVQSGPPPGWAAADGVAVDGGHNRFGQIEPFRQSTKPGRWHIIAAHFGSNFQIGPDAKRLFAGAGNNRYKETIIRSIAVEGGG